MAILSLLPGLAGSPESQLVTVLSVCLGLFAAYLYLRPSIAIPKGSPPLLREDWPLIGTFRFFTARWDFFREGIANSDTGNFSFHVGNKHAIGVSGDEGRKFFFESKDLDFASGYGSLFAGSPSAPQAMVADEDTIAQDNTRVSSEDPKWFLTRTTALLKGDILRKGLPFIIADTKRSMDVLAADPRGITDPFDSIFKLVYQLTMRTVACTEIADDPELLARTLHLYQEVESAATPTVVMFPSLPSPAKLRRMYAGAQLYMIFKKIVDARRATGTRHDDALQFLMDQGDDIRSIIQFVLGALFAGQLNSGINAAWLLVYLSQSPEWQAKAREEISSIAAKYDPDESKPLTERLSSLPAEAWETEFKVLEMCLKDSIRIQMAGAAFRKNTSGKDLKIGNAVVPNGSCVVYHTGDIHLNEDVYPDPLRWDPGRYLRGEDKRKPYGYIGWGVARHPCPGQRFARLESNVITALWMAYFEDFSFCDGNGNTEGVNVPEMNVNGLSAAKPQQKCYLKVRRRKVDTNQ